MIAHSHDRFNKLVDEIRDLNRVLERIDGEPDRGSLTIGSVPIPNTVGHGAYHMVRANILERLGRLEKELKELL